MRLPDEEQVCLACRSNSMPGVLNGRKKEVENIDNFWRATTEFDVSDLTIILGRFLKDIRMHYFLVPCE